MIRKLPPTVELIIILIIAFGVFTYSSTKMMLLVNSDYSSSWLYKLTTESYNSVLIYELLASILIILILKIRGWTLKDFNLQFSFRMLWTGFVLLFFASLIGGLSLKLFEVFDLFDDHTQDHVQFSLESSWLSLILAVIFNSIYEEFIVVGYLFKRLEKFHPALIIGLSVIIRELYHTYQGWISLFLIVPLGLVFGYYYYKYKLLWPLVIAHGLKNLITFLNMHFSWYENLTR